MFADACRRVRAHLRAGAGILQQAFSEISACQTEHTNWLESNLMIGAMFWEKY